jgi:hypothetical protein
MSRTPDVARDERGRLAAALVPAAWTGLALTAGRVLALVAMERYGHGNAGDLVSYCSSSKTDCKISLIVFAAAATVSAARS